MNTISETEVKEKLVNNYGSGYDRELIRSEIINSYGDVGTILYSLNGSPPKGYAMEIPESREVSFYDHQGKRFRQMSDTVVEDTTE